MAKKGSKARKNAESDYQKADQKAANRVRGINQAQSRLTDVRYQRNEETEHLDEVVRSDSKRFNDHDYHDKLAKHVRDSGVQISYQDKHRPGQVAVGPRNWRKSNITDMEWALRNKHNKVTLWREEIEELDELSKKTLGSYIKGASADAKYRAYNAGADDWGNGEDQKHPSRRTWPGRKDDDKAHQRLKGIATATDKLTKEETELDETSHVSKANIEEGTFDYHLKKALDSHERGDRKRTEYHLNNAKHARFGLSSIETVRKADKLNQYHKLATEYETKNEERDLDSRIAEIIEKRALEIENIRYIDESLTKSDPAEKWIHDFVHSDNPKFAGKSKSERRQMALGAYYGKQREKNEEIVSEERGWKEKEGGHHKTQGGARVAIKKYGNSWESTYYKDGISQDGGSAHPNVNVLKAKANIWLNKNKD